MLVGMVKADVVPRNNNSYAWPGSYGWGLGQHGQVVKHGSGTIDNALKNLTKQGDTVELVLDCDAAKLSLHSPMHWSTISHRNTQVANLETECGFA